MPIYVPGKRDPRHRNRIMSAKRTVVATLGLTAMVDMFTILVVFLLQNYSATGEIIYIPKDVQLPKASQIKELKPAHVVSITDTDIILDKEVVATTKDIKAQTDWMIPKLRETLAAAFQRDDVEAKQGLAQGIKNAVPFGKDKKPVDENRRKITVQADKELDFLTVKKVMFTVTEAGAAEINFAVVQREAIDVEAEDAAKTN
jgi:biopolymer transport protein ExbD